MRNYGEWKVLIEERDYATRIGVAIIKSEGESRIVALADRSLDRPIWTMQKLDIGSLTPDSLLFPADMAFTFFRAASLYLSHKGIKPVEQSYIDGKLTATEAHMRDLRHLLKLPKE